MPHQAPTFSIPAALLAEHEDLDQQLAMLTEVPGPLGAAASEVATLLRAHATREEAFALPLLALLPALAAGSIDSLEAGAAAPLARQLRGELPRMLEEHIAIVGALRTLLDMAQEIGRTDAAHFAGQLIRHAELEEQVLYPAALVAGEYLALRRRGREISS